MVDQQESGSHGGSPIEVRPAGEDPSTVVAPNSVGRRPPRTPSDSLRTRQRMSETLSQPETPPNPGRPSRSEARSASFPSELSERGSSDGQAGNATGASSEGSPGTDIANRLGEVVAGIDEVNINSKALHGTISAVQEGFGRLLALQETETRTRREDYLEERRKADSQHRLERDNHNAQNGRNFDELRINNEHLQAAQVVRVQQAADIYRAVNTFEAVFGDVAIVAQWAGRMARQVVAWSCNSGFPILVVALLTGVMIGIKHREMVNVGPVVVPSNATSRIAMVLESNPGWKELLKDPRPALEDLGNLGKN